MALDKQKILNELGNVVNQLQSADCGCMGKLFSNTNQGSIHMAGNHIPAYGGSCHHNCYGGQGFAQSPYSGDTGNNSHGMTNQCMGRCNPPKLYAETYNYLHDNLMKPVVNEVYNDLSSLNAKNTMPNNPLASQIGLLPSSGGGAGNGMPATNPGMMCQGDDGMTQNNMGAHSAGYANSMSENKMMGNMAGMGPQIMSMMGDGKGKSQLPTGNHGHSSQLASQAGYEQQQMAPSQGHNYQATDPGYTQNAGNNYLNQHNFNNASGAMNQQAYNMTNMNSLMHQNATSHSNTPVAQHANTAEYQFTPTGNQMNPTGQPMSPTTQQMNMNNQLNHPGQQISTNQNKDYGIHTQGVKKFNEFFPGVMQGVGGDLGFDPMSLAIQMNPANKHNSAMNSMQKLMMGDGKAKTPSHLGGNVGQPVNALQHGQGHLGQPNVISQHNPQTEQVPLTQQVPQTKYQQMIPTQQTSPGQNALYQQQQQVYSSVRGSPSINQQRKLIDPNTGAEINEPIMPSDGTPINAQQYMQHQYDIASRNQMANNTVNVKEPLYPADASRNSYTSKQEPAGRGYAYNTLGQPVEMLSTNGYRPPLLSLPQTLSPQPESHQNNKLHIKNTMSKTSLFGNKDLKRNPSRGQLQKIYHQYKGSQSYTQQNIRPDHVTTGSYSQGQLHQRQPVDEKQSPVEKVAGDTNINVNEIPNKIEHVTGQTGDVHVANKPPGDIPVKTESSMQKKHRNGLQDMVYTTYPQSTAWSFHGVRPPTIPHQYRLS